MSYLDTNKSVIISSPAGSGKTEKLARRYIALLKAGVDVERILAITFTEKASAEMKQRILRILKDEEEALFKKVLEKVSLMRVSTIHAFCATLLRRFSFETKVTPNYQIEEAISARILWEEILYEILMESQESEVRSQKSEARRELILKTIAEKGFRGLENLKDSINYLYEKAPFSLEAEVSNPPHSPFDKGGMGGFLEELKNWPGAKNFIDDYEDRFESYERLKQTEDYFLTDSKLPRKRNPKELKGFIDFQAWAERMHAYWRYIEMLEGAKRAERINDIFKRCYAKYKDKKSLRGVLDFSDLEYLAYKLLMEDPEWANVLYAFDEKTDHILVDEFQDTNNFQWAIIDRLTEEWRSGLGAKREEGTRPTMFLVGDEKQSIYFFRRANVEVFSRAKNKLKEWLGEEFYYEEVKENYRSLPPIIDFTNHLFSRLMNADKESPSWKTRYEPMAPQIASPDASKAGGVEMLLLEKGDDELTAEIKEKEAEVIARRIKTLVGTEVFDRRANQLRQCQYADIALLLRKRTHLKKYEDALREYEIPFVAVKGIGFYQEPEVAMLSAFIYFLSNPKDDYSLYVLLRSPLFMMDEEAILSALNDAQEDAPSDMFSRLKLQNPKPKTQNPIYNTIALLEECLMKTHHMPLAELIEDVLVQTNAWQYFHEPQRKGNVKKFIRIIEGLEADGRPLLAIRDFLERTSYKEDEPKANVNTEGMNAVKIMTIHASKGLEFPVVFIGGTEEKFGIKSDQNLIYEAEGRLFFKHMPDSALRKYDNDFMAHSEKEKEEQKRLFYVASTRAENRLILTGCYDDKENQSFLTFLKQGLGLTKNEEGYRMEAEVNGLSVLTEQDIDALYRKISAEGKRAEKERQLPGIPSELPNFPAVVSKEPQWRAVTEAVKIRRQHGKEWLFIGDVMHKVFEEISKGTLKEGDITERGNKLLALKGIVKTEREGLLKIIENDIAILKGKDIYQDIILPQENAYAELPFILEVEQKTLTPESQSPIPVVYSGRIDRVIVKDGWYHIYDYKTFPAEEKDLEYLLKEYSFQLSIYRKAVKELFNTKNVKSFILFTHTGEVREA